MKLASLIWFRRVATALALAACATIELCAQPTAPKRPAPDAREAFGLFDHLVQITRPKDQEQWERLMGEHGLRRSADSLWTLTGSNGEFRAQAFFTPTSTAYFLKFFPLPRVESVPDALLAALLKGATYWVVEDGDRVEIGISSKSIENDGQRTQSLTITLAGAHVVSSHVNVSFKSRPQER
jgi:hypothetical protein